MHFCVFAARTYGRFSSPRKIGLNWFIPAFVNSSVGSSWGTTGLDGTNVCPCFLTKKSMNCWRISLAERMPASTGNAGPELTSGRSGRKLRYDPGNLSETDPMSIRACLAALLLLIGLAGPAPADAAPGPAANNNQADDAAAIGVLACVG